MKRIISILLFGILLAGCGKQVFSKKDSGILRDMTGLDGCGWIIEAGSEKYNPGDISAFDITPEEGMKVRFKYRTLTGASTCMNGQLVELTLLKKD